MRLKKMLSAAVSAMIALTGFSFSAVSNNKSTAAEMIYKFDLGANPWSGYTHVSAGTKYNPSLGYGFNGNGVKDVSAPGSNTLSDAVQFTDNTTNFCVDLPRGLYRVHVTLGKTSRTSIFIENHFQIVNMTGDSAYDSVLVPVTDGQLNVRAAEGRAGTTFTISRIDVEKVSDDPTLPPTVWMCGDSTVCNYYPLDTSVQAGWGQVLDKFIDTNKWQVRNMASSGQIAKGFQTSGQFETVEYYGKPGDIYIISIGINDTNPNYTNETEYYNSVTDMVKRAKAKGMTVYLVKQQGRATDVTSNPNLTGRWFGTTLEKIGNEQNVAVIDLFNMFFSYCKSIGQDATTALYMNGDALHPNRQGAIKLAELASTQIDWDGSGVVNPPSTDPPAPTDPPEPPVEVDTNAKYKIKNKNSGLYMAVDGALASGSNVMQSYNPTMWTFTDAGSGYYFIKPSDDLYLDVTGARPARGTNIALYTKSGSSAQLFKLKDNGDGSVVILTKSASDNGCVEVTNAYTDSGANIQQWDVNGHACQSWIIEPFEEAPPIEPEPEIVPGEEADENVVIGDLNGDGAVNCFDFIIMKRTMDNIDGPQRQYADTNADGVVDIRDLKDLAGFLTRKNNFEAVELGKRFYYAKDASYSQAVKESSNAGFKKDSYINLENKKGSFIEWSISAPEEGRYYVNFQNANGSSDMRRMDVYINGELVDYMDFNGTGEWTNWKNDWCIYSFNRGKNTIRLVSADDNGGPNFDYLTIEKEAQVWDD